MYNYVDLYTCTCIRHGVIVIDNSNSKDYMFQGNSNRQSSNSISNSNIQSQC